MSHAQRVPSFIALTASTPSARRRNGLSSFSSRTLPFTALGQAFPVAKTHFEPPYVVSYGGLPRTPPRSLTPVFF